MELDPTAVRGSSPLPSRPRAARAGPATWAFYKAADLTALFGANGAAVTTAAGSTANPFTTLSVAGIAAAGYDSTQIASGGDVIQAVGNTTAGVEGVSNAINGALSGGGIGGTLASGTGTSGLAASLTLDLGGDQGSQLISFRPGRRPLRKWRPRSIASPTATGVAATTAGDQLQFNSTDYGMPPSSP